MPIQKYLGRKWRREATQRIQRWWELLDLSTQLAIAGLKTQGMSESEAWKVWCQRWARASKEHQRANLQIVRQLRARD